MGILSWLGFGNNSIKQAIEAGAVILDVRTPHEFDQGKIPGSINIPVDRIPTQLDRIKKMNKPIVLCCASGMRAGKAKGILKKAGIPEVHNGGGWQSLLRNV
ncbi:MAG: rhodanese-like domain-containing protein [Bacteroidota bacterium]